jgi:hypothetical protein
MEKGAKDIEMNFSVFISGLLLEGLAALGMVKHPLAEKIQKDLRHAGAVINTLAMLKEKTAGNLTKEESDGLEEAIHQLRMGYVATMEKDAKKGKE